MNNPNYIPGERVRDWHQRSQPLVIERPLILVRQNTNKMPAIKPYAWRKLWHIYKLDISLAWRK